MSDLANMSLQRLAERIEALEAENKRLRDGRQPCTNDLILSCHISTLGECLLAANVMLGKALERIERLERMAVAASSGIHRNDYSHAAQVVVGLACAIRDDLAELDRGREEGGK